MDKQVHDIDNVVKVWGIIRQAVYARLDAADAPIVPGDYDNPYHQALRDGKRAADKSGAIPENHSAWRDLVRAIAKIQVYHWIDDNEDGNDEAAG